jgi:HlyD family secretion protein
MNHGVKPRRRLRLSRPQIATFAIVAVALATLAGWQLRPKAEKEPYRQAAVERGDITRSVSASGSLQALITVDVGSQISGQISKVMVDFNDQVKKGQVLATIDPQTFESRVAQGQADIAAGVAAVKQAEANLANAKADYDRKKVLVERIISITPRRCSSTLPWHDRRSVSIWARLRAIWPA